MTCFWKTTNALPRSFAEAWALSEVTWPVTLTVSGSSCSTLTVAAVLTFGSRLTLVTLIVLEDRLPALSSPQNVSLCVLPFFHSRAGQKPRISAWPSPSERENLPSTQISIRSIPTPPDVSTALASTGKTSRNLAPSVGLAIRISGPAVSMMPPHGFGAMPRESAVNAATDGFAEPSRRYRP